MRQPHSQYHPPVWVAVVFATLLAACTAPSEWRDSVRESIDTTLQESRKSAKQPVPEEINQALLPPI
ncbi:MAG: hypothetical protein HY082_07875 [Gammaproteobacteria bacterium]|nr:hypothetical protein [Gammaproteobacteria bacterium]